MSPAIGKLRPIWVTLFWSMVGLALASCGVLIMVWGLGFSKFSLADTADTVASTSDTNAPSTVAPSTVAPPTVAPSTVAPSSVPEAPPASQTPPVPTPSPSPPTVPPSITIKAVGDMIPGTNFPDYRLPDRQPQILFQRVLPYLKGADVLFGNYESTLTDYPRTPKDVRSGRSFAFRAPPAYAAIIRKAGFDILSVANNHSFDFDTQGFKDTVRHIEAAGMQAIGRKGEIRYRRVNGMNTAWIGFSTYSDHNSIHDLQTAQTLVRRAREKAAIVIISFHAGAEGDAAQRVQGRDEFFFGENRGNVRRFARTMIDAEADLVLGHGPHVLRGIELYRGRLIAYSLGNFLGYQTLSTAGIKANSMILEANLEANGKFVKGRIIPLRLDGDGIPAFDPQLRSVQMIRELTRLDFPQTPLQISTSGDIKPIALTSKR